MTLAHAVKRARKHSQERDVETFVVKDPEPGVRRNFAWCDEVDLGTFHSDVPESWVVWSSWDGWY